MKKYERRVGTVVRGIRMPIIREGDDLAEIVTTGILEAAEFEGFQLRDRDVIAMTESIVARAQGNYCTVDDIADDVREKLAERPSASSSRSCPGTVSRSAFAASHGAAKRSS